MEIICDNHNKHDSKWVFDDQCIACMIESLGDSGLTKARKKVVLVYFLKTVRSSCRVEITSLLACNAAVVSRIIQSLVDLVCLGNREVVLHPLVGETLMELVCLLGNVKVEEETVMTVAKKLEEIGLKGSHFSDLANLLGQLLQKHRTVLPASLNESSETVNLLLQGLTYLDEEVQMSCSFTWFQILANPTQNISEKLQEQSSLPLSLIGIATLQRVAFDVLFVLDACDLSEDLELNMLGLLKVLIGSSLEVQDVLMKVAEHGDGVQIMLVLKKLIRGRKIRVQVVASQCLLVLLRGELCSGHSELAFRADLAEYLFEALSTSSDVLISSLLKCLELLAQQETFYSRHFDVYGIESLVRCADGCNTRHFICSLGRAYKLLIVLLKSHKASDLKLFMDSNVYVHLLDVILESANISGPFQKDARLAVRGVAETFLLLLRIEHFPEVAPLKKISEVASVLIRHTMSLLLSSSSSSPSSLLPPDGHLSLSAKHLQNIYNKEAPDDLWGGCMLLVSDLILHQWRILTEVLEGDLLDDDAFQGNRGLALQTDGSSDVFGCRDFFEHLYRAYFAESVSLLVRITRDTSNTFSMVPINVVASNFLASISTCYRVFQLLSEKYPDRPSRMMSSHSPFEFSQTVMEASDREFFIQMFAFKSWSCISDETKSSVDKVLLEVLKPLLVELIGAGTSREDEGNISREVNVDLTDLFDVMSRGFGFLEGSLKEVIDEFVAMVSAPCPSLQPSHDFHGSLVSRGVALLASLYLYTIDNKKYFIPRRNELILSFVGLRSRHHLSSSTPPPSSSSSSSSSSLHSCPVVSTATLKFVVHLLTLEGRDGEKDDSCVSEGFSDADGIAASHLSEWMEMQTTTSEVWCPRPLQLLYWAYQNGLLYDFSEHFLLPLALKTSERTEEVMITMVHRFEPCLKSVMSIFASSEDREVLVNVLDLLRACLVAPRGPEGRSPRGHIGAVLMSAAPKVFIQFGDSISKYNKALFINLMTFFNDNIDDIGEQSTGEPIRTQDLRLVECVESLLEVSEVFSKDDIGLYLSSLTFINSMLVKSYGFGSKQVFLLLTSASDRVDRKLLRFINSVNSDSLSLDCDEEVFDMYLLSLFTVCILLTFHATFALPFGYRLYVHESNVDLSARLSCNVSNARSKFNDDDDSGSMVLSQTIKSLFWSLYFMCGSLTRALDATLAADGLDSNVAGTGFLKILVDEKMAEEKCLTIERFGIANIPDCIARGVYNAVLNLMASENELLRICCVNCMSAIVRYLDSKDGSDAARERGKLKTHLLNLYWLDYLVKNILINITSSNSPSIPVSYLKLFDLLLHQNPEAMMALNGTRSDDLINIKEMPRVVAAWFCREEVQEGSSLLLSIINKITDKNMLKSDKKLKEQVSEKLKNIGSRIPRVAAGNAEEGQSTCSVLLRLHKKLQIKHTGTNHKAHKEPKTHSLTREIYNTCH